MGQLHVFLLISLAVGTSLQAEKKSPLKIHLATWNVGESKPPSSVDALLGLTSSPLPDLVVLATQEASNVLEDWTRKLLTVLSAKGFFQVKTVEMGFIQLNVFASYDLQDNVVSMKDGSLDFFKGDLMGIGRKKGANFLRMRVYDSNLCFVNTHLEADCKSSMWSVRVCPFGEHVFKKRVEQFNDANKQRLSVCSGEDDFTFWLGDLNWRLNGKISDSDRKSLTGDGFKGFLEKDQLNQAREKGEAFKEYTEPPIDFRPTYKFKDNKYKSDRTPAWTDRILYLARKPNSLSVETYTSLPEYSTSDHKPVVARYSINI